MTFDIETYHAFVKLLYEHPEWRAEVRQLVLSQDILILPEVVRELAEAQKRTEQRVEELAEAQKRSEERLTRLEQVVAELAEAQKRTEQRVEELAEAQKRSEERLTRLEQAVAELAEAQKRSEERLTRLEQAVAELAEAQKRTDQKVDRLASELGGLKNLIGASLEEESAAVTETVMRQKGFRLLEEAHTLRWNGEVDVILRVEDPQGRRLCVVVETKTRLSKRDVIAWSQRVRSSGWQKQLHKMGYDGPYLVYVYAIRADVAAKEAVRGKGIGLMKGEGEIIPPAGEIGA